MIAQKPLKYATASDSVQLYNTAQSSLQTRLLQAGAYRDAQVHLQSQTHYGHSHIRWGHCQISLSLLQSKMLVNASNKMLEVQMTSETTTLHTVPETKSNLDRSQWLLCYSRSPGSFCTNSNVSTSCLISCVFFQKSLRVAAFQWWGIPVLYTSFPSLKKLYFQVPRDCCEINGVKRQVMIILHNLCRNCLLTGTLVSTSVFINISTYNEINIKGVFYLH